MAHEVRIRIDTAIARHKDFEIIVKGTDGKIGTILVSKGNIEWRPSGYTVNKFRLTWTKFAELMEKNGKSVKVP